MLSSLASYLQNDNEVNRSFDALEKIHRMEQDVFIDLLNVNNELVKNYLSQLRRIEITIRCG